MEKVGTLKSGEVVVNRHNDHVHSTDQMAELLPKALSKIDAKGRNFLVEEVDFGRVIGETICIATGLSDQILFAQRPKRAGLTRFVMNRVPESCSSLVVILKKAEGDNLYILITAFIGKSPQPEPWDKNLTNEAREKSLEFWATHALIWGEEVVIPGTEITLCPW